MKRNRKWSKEGGVVMNVFGRIEEAFTLPWFWKEKFGLGRWRMLELSRLEACKCLITIMRNTPS